MRRSLSRSMRVLAGQKVHHVVRKHPLSHGHLTTFIQGGVETFQADYAFIALSEGTRTSFSHAPSSRIRL
jgi:hypothetical protein